MQAQVVPNQGVRAVGPNIQPADPNNLIGATLLPFGPAAGDTALPKADDGFEFKSVSPLAANGLPYSIPFYGRRHPGYFVSVNGVISFDAGVSSYSPEAFPTSLNLPIVAPYWADVDTRPAQYGGNVYHRVITDYAQRMEIGARITACYFGYVSNTNPTAVSYRRGPFLPTMAIVATWDRVGYYNQKTDRVNTFQAVIATDGMETYTLFLYPNKAIWWDMGEASGSAFPNVGIDAGNGNCINAAGARTAAMRDLWFLTNTNPAQRGTHIYALNAMIPNRRQDPALPPPSVPETISSYTRDLWLPALAAGQTAHVLNFEGGFDRINRLGPADPVILRQANAGSVAFINEGGALSGAPFSMEGPGAFVLSQPGTVQTALRLTKNVTIRLQAPEALSTLADLTFETATNPASAGGNLAVTEDATVGSLIGIGGNQGTITGTKRLAVTNDEDAAFNGTISGSLTLVKRGPGSQTLGGNNTYTGTTTVEDGMLGLAHAAATGTGPLIMRGGEIRAAGAARTLAKPLAVEGDFRLGRLTHFTGLTTLAKEVKITSMNPDTHALAESSFTGGITGNGGLTFTEGANPIGKIRVGGTLTYTGRTRVLKGRVEAAAALPSTTDVVLSRTAVLETSGGAASYPVKSLTLAGVPAQPGLWGAPGSGAPLTSPLLAGTVPLQVTGTADPYLIWSLDIPDEQDRSRGQDPDRDGRTNVQEYLFGTPALEGTGAQVVSTAKEDGTLSIRWLERKAGAAYTLQVSAGLKEDWETSTLVAAEVAGAVVPEGYQQMEVIVTPGAARKFFRVKAAE